MNDEATPDGDARNARAAQREADTLRRDRERAAERERRDAEKAAAQRRRDEAQRERQQAQRDRERDQRERERERQEAQREREAQRAVDEAAREAAAASREAARIAAEAQRAERRAAHHAQRAHERARSLDPAQEPAPDDEPRLPREIAVLWRREPPARRGPRPGLTLDEIADAGIAIADAEGIEAVSMARIAAELGYTAMSLYRYVTSKDEVIAIMVDRVIGAPPPVDPAAGWRERLGTVARGQLPVLFAHPWMAATGSVVNVLGPHRVAWMEAFVAALDGTPLTATQKLVVAGALGNQALADVRTSVEMAEFDRRAAARGEPSGFELLGTALVDPAVHPSLAAAFAAGALADMPGEPGEPGDVGRRQGEPHRPAVAAAPSTGGIDLIVDGVAAWIAAAGQPPTAPPAGAPGG